MTQPLQFVAPEEAARADYYGLISRLFLAAPDPQLISQIVQSGAAAADESELGSRWREIVEGCRSAFPRMLEQEHTDLFIGTGKAEVTPYLSHYVLRHPGDVPLVTLRQQLAEWGIARRENVPEYEDHVAALCETMRFIIAAQHRSLREQRDFFDRFLYRGAIAFCDAVTASEKARFYRSVASFARAFFEVEKAAFEMVD